MNESDVISSIKFGNMTEVANLLETFLLRRESKEVNFSKKNYLRILHAKGLSSVEVHNQSEHWDWFKVFVAMVENRCDHALYLQVLDQLLTFAEPFVTETNLLQFVLDIGDKDFRNYIYRKICSNCKMLPHKQALLFMGKHTCVPTLGTILDLIEIFHSSEFEDIAKFLDENYYQWFPEEHMRKNWFELLNVKTEFGINFARQILMFVTNVPQDCKVIIV
jgi:hypothetical protein